MQKWEYLLVIRYRSIEKEYKRIGSEYKSVKPGSWKIMIKRPDQEDEFTDGSFTKVMNELGEEGWELVSSTAVSNEFDLGLGGTSLLNYENRAGFTNSMYLIFKHPKA